MTDEMNKFWDELKEKATDPEAFTALTDAEAERRMAEAGEEPMSDEEVEKIVRSATAQGPQGIVHRDIEKPQAHYFMKVAAAVLITVALAAGVVSTKVLLWPERDDESHRFQVLKYRDAILVALTTKEEENDRNTSIFRIGTSTRVGIRGLQQVRGNEGALRMLLETLASPAVFEERHLSRVHALKYPVKDSVEFIQDASNPLDDRERRQQELRDQLELGILALKKVHATEKAGGRLWESARRGLELLRRQLEQD